MRYCIEYTPSAQHDLIKLGKRMRQRAYDCIHALADDPYPPSCRRLTGPLRDYAKIRVGDYRVIYWVGSDVVRVVRVGHRSNVYKDLGRA